MKMKKLTECRYRLRRWASCALKRLNAATATTGMCFPAGR